MSYSKIYRRDLSKHKKNYDKLIYDVNYDKPFIKKGKHYMRTKNKKVYGYKPELKKDKKKVENIKNVKSDKKIYYTDIREDD